MQFRHVKLATIVVICLLILSKVLLKIWEDGFVVFRQEISLNIWFNKMKLIMLFIMMGAAFLLWKDSQKVNDIISIRERDKNRDIQSYRRSYRIIDEREYREHIRETTQKGNHHKE